MGRKKVLEKRMARLQAKVNELNTRAAAADVTVEELRSIQNKLLELREDIAEVEEELATFDMTGDEGDLDEPVQPVPGQEQQQRSVNPMASYGNLGQNAAAPVNPYATTEYRSAFMAYVQRGVAIPAELHARAGGDTGTTLSTEIGAIIPETIMTEFIKEVSKVYGNIYAKVRKLNVKGGVKFPISKLKANFKWITETTVSEKQKAGDIKDFVVFEYNIGEIRVAETLLAQVVSLDVFESDITRIMVEAYVEAMDKMIIAGTGSGLTLPQIAPYS